MLQIEEFAGRLLDLLAAGILSAFGGVAAYIYGNTKSGSQFKVGGFIANALVAFFVGNVCGSFIPHDMTGRDGILLMAGFCSFPILALLEIYVIAWFKKKAGEVSGVTDDDLKPNKQDKEQ